MSRQNEGFAVSSGTSPRTGGRWLCAVAVWIGFGWLVASYVEGGAGGLEEQQAVESTAAQSVPEPTSAGSTPHGRAAALAGGLVNHAVTAIDFNRLGHEAFGDNEDGVDAR